MRHIDPGTEQVRAARGAQQQDRLNEMPRSEHAAHPQRVVVGARPDRAGCGGRSAQLGSAIAEPDQFDSRKVRELLL